MKLKYISFLKSLLPSSTYVNFYQGGIQMTNSEKIRSMTDEQLAKYLTDKFLDQDWLDKMYKEICSDICPISGRKCLIHIQDDACVYNPDDIFKSWLNKEEAFFE